MTDSATGKLRAPDLTPGARVAVIAAGLKAPGGNSPEELWASLAAARSFAAPFEDERLPPGVDLLVSSVSDFDPAGYLAPHELRRFDRCHHLAIAAAEDAIDAVPSFLPPPERCAVVCGVALGAAMTFEWQHEELLAHGLRAMSPLAIAVVMPSSTAALLSMRFNFRGPSLTVSTACASGAMAIGEGVELLRRGAADLVLAGGVDSLASYGVLCSFARLDVMSRNVAQPDLASRPFDAARDGFVMGEGAGFVVLQRAEDAEAAGHQPLGMIAGYGSSADGHRLLAPSVNGEGALRSMRVALADAGVAPEEVSHVSAHGTSTVLNDIAEGRALTSLFGENGPPVTAVKGSTGHLMGGSGAVEAIVALRTLRCRLVPPIAGLVDLDPKISINAVTVEPRPIGPGYGICNSLGFGGVNAALVVAEA